MAEYRFFPEGEVPRVSTLDFHRDRGRAAHLEQPNHRERLETAVEFVGEVYRRLAPDPVMLSDLGCGDGGLLSKVDNWTRMTAWGYDFTPANVAGARERWVKVEELDVFGADRSRAQLGDVVVMTEVLEHLADPHEVLRWLITDGYPLYLVASSPWDETPESHDECHAWAWDVDGYATLLTENGWDVVQHVKLSYKFQVVLAMRCV